LGLSGHPNVAALNDELKIVPLFTRGVATFTYGNDRPEEKEAAFSALFDAITLLRANDNTQFHGAKIVCNSPKAAAELVHALQNHFADVKIVLVVRTDLVALFGSRLIAKKSGIMHSWYKGFEKRKVDKVVINRWRFPGYAVGILETYNTLRELAKTHQVYEARYEDLIDDSAAYFRRIFSFLGLSQLDPTWLMSKKVLPPPQEYISNYAAMSAVMERIIKGEAGPFEMFVSKIVNHLYWRVRSFRR
jgi:hypothetical protein